MVQKKAPKRKEAPKSLKTTNKQKLKVSLAAHVVSVK